MSKTINGGSTGYLGGTLQDSLAAARQQQAHVAGELPEHVRNLIRVLLLSSAEIAKRRSALHTLQRDTNPEVQVLVAEFLKERAHELSAPIQQPPTVPRRATTYETQRTRYEHEYGED